MEDQVGDYNIHSLDSGSLLFPKRVRMGQFITVGVVGG